MKIDNKSVSEYWDLGEIKSIAPFGHGHINDTYLVKSSNGEFILQKVNKNVFRTSELVSNYEILVNAVGGFESDSGKKITPGIYKTKAGSYHFVDSENSAWRLVELIPAADSYDICPNPQVAYKAAKALGEYQLFLNTIDPLLFQDTIVGFHNLPERFKAFENSVENAGEQLLESSSYEVQKSLELAYIVDETMKSITGLPVRINHNDTKLNNVIFKDDDVLVIDLDTVMLGNVMFDFGDMVRTFTSPAMEDEKDISKTKFRIEFFEALTRGYLEPLGENLSDKEKESLFAGALYIIYEQVLRFLTDYLRGNVYYKVAYPEHNLVRTRTQLTLLELILENRNKLEKIIASYC